MVLAAKVFAVLLVIGLVVVGLLARDASITSEDQRTDRTREGQEAGETGEEASAERREDGDVAILLCDGRSCPEITDGERSELEAELEAHALVTDLEYESKEQAYQRSLVMFEDRPDIIGSTDPDALPAAFRVWVEDPMPYLENPLLVRELAEGFASHGGVDEVVDALEPIRRHVGSQ